MIRWIRGWLRRRSSPPKRFPHQDEETRRLLRGLDVPEDGERALSGSLYRHERLVRAMEARAALLCDAALTRMEEGSPGIREWTLAVSALDRLLEVNPLRFSGYLGRAALYLGAAARLRSLGESAHASLEQAWQDLSLALALAPRSAAALSLQGLTRRLVLCDAGEVAEYPAVREIREAWKAGRVAPAA